MESLPRDINMDHLIKEIEALKRSDVSKIIDMRIQSFSSMNSKDTDTIFQELCYCILTANCQADRCMMIQLHLSKEFLTTSTEHLSRLLRDHGYRFPNTRASYITTARQYKNEIKDILITKKGDQRRIWFVQHINGFGYKEASHFLRNIGYFNYAIIDTHIIKVLSKSSIDIPSKTLTYNTYISIEEKLKHIAEKVDLSLGELDLYLWYMETGTILK